MDFVDLKTPYRQLKESINARIGDVLNHGQYILGPEVNELEERLADYVGVDQCIGVSSGTDALLIALMACDIGLGDEVITSPFSFASTAEVILLLGAKPVFVDIDPRTYNMDPSLLEAAITEHTKAIVPVSLYGQCADFDKINKIADQYALTVIEDGAQSFGATYNGRNSCALSHIGITSFFPSKPLGCFGDGGALFTDDERLAKRIREIRVHGQDGRYNHIRLGINGRMDTIQAAILLAKLEIFSSEVEARGKVGSRYTALIEEALEKDNKLKKIISLPYIEPHNVSVYAQYTIQVPNREAVQERMNDYGVPTAVHYPMPLHWQPVFVSTGITVGNCPMSEAAASHVISLPMHPYINQDQQGSIVSALLNSV
jgi:UDP-2-acetamido-2-deoxy-ribo-hexuluronate aminotransferase